MDTGSHIPPYLFCERFAQGSRVIDLLPPSEQGATFLARSARLTVVVQKTIADHSENENENGRITRLVGDPDNLPIIGGSFDLVLVTAPGKIGSGDEIEQLVKSARSLINPSGVIAITIPNRDAVGMDIRSHSNFPDFLEFERNLRRHFPHVMLFSQQPLHGATLTPLGRRANFDGPVLDDRMIPEGGEVPSHFLAVCSPKFRRVDDTIIAQLPFRTLADQVRARVEKLEGTVSLVRQESDVRLGEVTSLNQRIEKLTDQLARTELDGRDLASRAKQVSELKDEVTRRKGMLEDLEVASERQASEHSRSLDEFHAANRRIRALEKQIEDARRMDELARQEREDNESERQKLVTELHEAHARLKTKQREMDDVVEELAGTQEELAAFHKEAGKQRRELVSAREQIRRLDLKIAEAEDSEASLSSLEAEMERIREHASTERKRLEENIDEEHRQMLEEMSKRNAAVLETRNMQTQLREISDDLGQAVQAKADEIERQAHTIALLSSRASDAEERAVSSQKKLAEIHSALQESEGKIVELESSCERAESLANALEEAHKQTGDLQETIGRLRPEASSSKTARQRAIVAETAVSELEDLHQRLNVKKMELEATIADMTGRLTASESELAESRAHKVQLEEDLSESNAHQVQLEEDLSESNAHQVQLEEDLSESNAHQVQLEEDLSKSNAHQVQLEEDLSKSNAHQVQLEEDLSKSKKQVTELRNDITGALVALAESEEGAGIRTMDVGDRISDMKEELERLREENETELLLVREDLETELRQTNSLLESRQGEIWELREEVVRLQAQVAASAASSSKDGTETDFQRTLAEQEVLINEISAERDRLRKDDEKKNRSLENRKKNLKILAALLRRERAKNLEGITSEDSTAQEALDDDKTMTRKSLVTRELDIAALIAEAGGQITDDIAEDLKDDEELDAESEIEAAMNSVLNKKPQTEPDDS